MPAALMNTSAFAAPVTFTHADTFSPTINVWTVRHGSAVRVAVYNDKAEALEAAGLSEQDVSSA